MTSPLDDALRRTSEAVHRYSAPDDMISLAAGSLGAMTPEQRARSSVNALIDAVLDMAWRHAGPHGDGCESCHSVRNGLAVAMGVVRAEVDAEFGQRLEG